MSISDGIIDDLGNRYYAEKPSRYSVALIQVQERLQTMLVKNGLLLSSNDSVPEEVQWQEAAFRTRTRVKRFSRILEKADRRNISCNNIDEFELKIGDIAGAKVLVPYWEDAYKLGKAICKQGGWKLCKGGKEDYVKKPQKTGYRALHYTVQFDVKPFKDMTCEIQIKTDPMDAWAERTHDLIYKGGKIPIFLTEFAKMQADLIYQTDRALELIKAEILRLRGKPQ
jgi:ppGpp synthetase/RelA/SpoT-type nucleotidyltranferase